MDIFIIYIYSLCASRESNQGPLACCKHSTTEQTSNNYVKSPNPTSTEKVLSVFCFGNVSVFSMRSGKSHESITSKALWD